MLAGRSRTAPREPEPAPAPEREPDRTGYRERAQREAERFRLATDSEYWICLCFRTPEAAAGFCRAAGVTPQGRYIPGPRLARRTRTPLGSRAHRMLTARSSRGTDTAALLAGRPAADPLERLPEPTHIEQDSLDELTAILAALTAPADPSPVNILDSPHWVAACWPHRDAKDEWLTETGVDVIGDKYVDGHQAAAILGIHLKEV
jgi:hypothetical protein